MVGCHDQLNGDEFGLTLGDGGANSGRPGMLQSMGLQRIGHD